MNAYPTTLKVTGCKSVVAKWEVQEFEIPPREKQAFEHSHIGQSVHTASSWLSYVQSNPESFLLLRHGA